MNATFAIGDVMHVAILLLLLLLFFFFKVCLLALTYLCSKQTR